MQGVTTDDIGQFSIKLDFDYEAGYPVVFRVRKNGWVVNDPVDGKWNLPSEKIQDSETFSKDVIIVPKGSKKLWSDRRIEDYIDTLHVRLAKMKRGANDTARKNLDINSFLSQWAKEFGFTVGQVRTAFEKWADQAGESDDLHVLGLKAFYRREFPKAASYFGQAAELDEKEITELEKRAVAKAPKAVKNWNAAGLALEQQSLFDSAIVQYDRAKVLAGKYSLWPLLAETEVLQGWAKFEAGIRASPVRGVQLLQEARDGLEAALQFYTPDSFPQEWAWAQNIKGIVLHNLSIRLQEEGESLSILYKAGSAYVKALKIYTQKDYPLHWAEVMNNAGIALQELAKRDGSENGPGHLRNAAYVCDSALTVYTRKKFPNDWSAVQNNKGCVLTDLGKRLGSGGGARFPSETRVAFQDAIQAFDSALMVRSRKKQPQQWAGTQFNKGIALQGLGAHLGGKAGEKYLRSSAIAYDSALSVLKRVDVPQKWADAMNNKGTVLADLGIRLGGEPGMAYFQKSVAAFDSVLTIFTIQALPKRWAEIQINKGNALRAMGLLNPDGKGKDDLMKSAEAFGLALGVNQIETAPNAYASTSYNLGLTYLLLGERLKADSCLANARKISPQFHYPKMD